MSSKYPGVHVVGLDERRAYLRAYARRLPEATQAAAEEAAKYGRDLMKQYISTRGTPKSGKEGRIETSKMLNAVQAGPSRVLASGGASTQFGWMDKSEFENYFFYQEGGFTSNNGAVVPPMHALLDARIKTDAYFKKLVREAVKV